MLPYFTMFLLVMVFAFKDFVKVPHLYKEVLGYILLLILICFFGFRFECDNDYTNYVGIYSSTPSLSVGISEIAAFGVFVGVEVGYCLISSGFKMFNFIPQSIFIFSAILTFVIMHQVFRKHSIYPGIAMLVYFSQFFSLPFIQMRFGIAMALVLLACVTLFKGNKLRFWLLIVCGALFHICALGGIAVYFFSLVKWVKKPVAIWSVLLGSLVLMLFPMRNILVTLMGSVGIDKYTTLYADTESASPISVIVSVILILPLIYYREALQELGIKVNDLLSMSLCSIVIGCVVWQLGILNRFSMITAVSFCLILPTYLLLLKSRKDKLVGFLLIIAYCFFKFLPSINHVTDYQVFLTH